MHPSQIKGRGDSVSPDSKIKKQGQQFLTRIEELQKNLEIQGEALAFVDHDLNASPGQVRKMPKSNNERETVSQKIVGEQLKQKLEAKKAAEEAARLMALQHSNLNPVTEQAPHNQANPTAIPVNYNAIRKMELAELDQDYQGNPF